VSARANEWWRFYGILPVPPLDEPLNARLAY
jgi:hypothetical protein